MERNNPYSLNKISTAVATIMLFAGAPAQSWALSQLEDHNTGDSIYQQLFEPYKPRSQSFGLIETLYSEEERAKMLVDFAKSIIDNIEDMPPEFNKEIDDKFWELF